MNRIAVVKYPDELAPVGDGDPASREQVANASDATVFTTPDGEALIRSRVYTPVDPKLA